MFAPKRNVASSTLTAILSQIATNGMANTDATCLKSLYVGDVKIYYDFRYRHCMTSCQDRYKSSPEQQNCFPFFAAITQRVQLTRLWDLLLPPVARNNHNLLIAPSAEFLRLSIWYQPLVET